MSKFTLASLAVLCTLFISCSQQELDLIDQDDLKIESRSSNPISVSYTNENGVPVSTSCTHAEVSYLNSTYATIYLEMSNTATSSSIGSGLMFSVGNDYALNVMLDSTTTINVTDLSIDACGTTVCYFGSSGEGIVSGTALDFIIEDHPAGL